MTTVKSAAEMLEGLSLDDGWTVDKLIERDEKIDTGGKFSYGYEISKGNEIAFLKAFDFSSAFLSGVDTATELERLTKTFNHERWITEYCGIERMSRVSYAVKSGQVIVPEMSTMEGTVLYLIFEKAVGDVRRQLSLEYAGDINWCMSAIRNVCIGLDQLHRKKIAHQDLKPSNVLEYSDSNFKVSDLGRSSMIGRPIEHDDFVVPGDKTYAPLELLYGFTHPEFVNRRMGTDFYMLGNLIVYMFTGVTINSRVFKKLDEGFHYDYWRGGYKKVLAHLQHTFEDVMIDLSTELPEEVREELIPITRQLCNPDINQRGIPKDIDSYKQFSLEKYITKFDYLCKIFETRLRISKRNK